MVVWYSSALALAEHGAPPEDWAFTRWQGQIYEGSAQFDHLPRSCALEVRFQISDSEVASASLPVSVDCAGPEASLWTDRPFYPSGVPIEIRWVDAEGWREDWVAIAHADAPDGDAIAYDYTDPVTLSGPYSGSLRSDDLRYGGALTLTLAPGFYEARLHANDTDRVQARATFRVD